MAVTTDQDITGIIPTSGGVYDTPTLTGAINTAAATGISTPVYCGGVPFIALSSGSVNASGAISGITNLPAIYPSAYCYFPANILATTIAAGWYYCTFSGLAAGTAFLDTYTSGQATIPASPTPVTDGKGAFTGDTGEEVAIQVTLPALTANASLNIYPFSVTCTNNANAKTTKVKINTTIFLTGTSNSVASAHWMGNISNTGSAAKQHSVAGVFSGSMTQLVLGTVDTSTAQVLSITLQRATATDNLVLLPPTITLNR